VGSALVRWHVNIRTLFPDFLRGLLDGDGCTYSFYDSVWVKSYRFYTKFCSASLDHIVWLHDKILEYYLINGVIDTHNKSVNYLSFAKHDSIRLLEKIYYSDNVLCLTRKRLKIERSLTIINCSPGLIEE